MRIGFEGYAGDCIVVGQIDSGDSRLSDLLDRLDDVVLHDATLHSLADDHQVEAGELVIKRDELFAVASVGDRSGDSQRRVRTIPHLLQLALGPYTCFGELHALPGVPPLRTLLVRRTMLPLTNCVLVFRRGDHHEVRRLPLLIANGRHIDHVEETTREQVEIKLEALDSALAAPPAGGRAAAQPR